MIVSELIELLHTMPQDAPVIYRFCSEWEELTEDRVSLSPADSNRPICKHEGRYMEVRPEWLPAGETRTPVTVVTFPGN